MRDRCSRTNAHAPSALPAASSKVRSVASAGLYAEITRSCFTACSAVTCRYDSCSLSITRVSATTNPADASAFWIRSHTSFE